MDIEMTELNTSRARELMKELKVRMDSYSTKYYQPSKTMRDNLEIYKDNLIEKITQYKKDNKIQ